MVGRKKCLFVTVLGTASPVMALCISSNLWVFAAAAAFSGDAKTVNRGQGAEREEAFSVVFLVFGRSVVRLV